MIKDPLMEEEPLGVPQTTVQPEEQPQEPVDFGRAFVESDPEVLMEKELGSVVPPTLRQEREFAMTGSREAERFGFAPVQRDSAIVEFGQNITGSLVDSIRMMASTGEELGIVPSRFVRSIEDWQDVNQHLQMYEGATPFSSWGGFWGSVGQVGGYAIPTIAVGAVTAKLGAVAGLTGAALRAVTTSGTAAAMHSQHFGDDVKFFRDEAGMSPVMSIMLGFASATAKTAPEMLLGVERKVVDMVGRGIALNTIKAGALSPALREGMERTAREALLARVVGNTRPYFSTLKYWGLDVGSESATEMMQLAVDDFNRVTFKGGEFSSLAEYFDTAVSVIPGTIFLGGFAAYRGHRNQMIYDDMLKPVSQKEVASAAKVFGQQKMEEFNQNVERLRGEFMKSMRAAHGQESAEQMANSAADMLAKIALKSALKVDRADGQRVSPNDFVEGFRTALASRNITADEFAQLGKMTQEQAMNALADWGIIDESDRLVKSSDAEENTYIANEIKKDMQIILDPAAIERRQSILKAAAARGALGDVEVQIDVDPLEGVKPIETKDKILEAKKKGEKDRQDPIAKAAQEARQQTKGKIYTGPMSIAEAKAEGAIIINESPTTKEAATVLSNPAIVTIGGKPYVEQLAGNGKIVLVPPEMARGVEIRRPLTEITPQNVKKMGAQQRGLFLDAVKQSKVADLTTQEFKALQDTMTAIDESANDKTKQMALEALREFEAANAIAGEVAAPAIEEDTIQDALFRIKGVADTVAKAELGRGPQPIKTPEQEARMVNAEALKSTLDAAMRRRVMQDAETILIQPTEKPLQTGSRAGTTRPIGRAATEQNAVEGGDSSVGGGLDFTFDEVAMAIRVAAGQQDVGSIASAYRDKILELSSRIPKELAIDAMGFPTRAGSRFVQARLGLPIIDLLTGVEGVPEGYVREGDRYVFKGEPGVQFQTITPAQDAEYLAAVEAGDMETAQRMVDEAAREAGYTYHRYTRGSPSGDVPWMMFAVDKESVENAYGNNHYVASDRDAIDIEDLIPDITDALEEYGSSQFIRDNAESIAKELNPENIVNSAGSWDDAEVVQDVWDRVLEDRGILKVKTTNGLIVMAEQDSDGNPLVKSADPVVKDNKGNVIPLSERFNSKKSDIRYQASTADTLDAEYLAAVEAGDMETAQRMVDEAAKEAGYAIGPVWHGTAPMGWKWERGGVVFDDPTITTPRIPMYFAENKAYAQGFAQLQANERALGNNARVLGAFVRMDKPYRPESRSYWKALRANPVGEVSRLQQEGYDGVEMRETPENREDMDGLVYVPFSPSQIKSADPITRDDQGNVIPLSQRFQQESADIRFQKIDKFTPPAGLYIASEKLAVFFSNENLTPATLLHEWFHHLQASNLMPAKLQMALDKEFGSIKDKGLRLEREAEAFTRYLTDGKLPITADDELAEAFEYVKKVSKAAYQSATLNWKLPNSVKAELDNLFMGADYDFEQEAVGQATQAALEYDQAVNFMSMKSTPEMIRFHTERRNIGLRMGMTDQQVRQLLIDGGFKGYIKASDDPSKQQESDMTTDEMVEAYEYLREKNTGLSERKLKAQERKMAVYRDEDVAKDFRTIYGSIQSRPSIEQNYGDAFGSGDKVKSLLGTIKRGVKYGLTKSATFWNIAKMLDGGQENGPISTMVRDRVNAGERLKYETIDEVNTTLTKMRKELGEVAEMADLGEEVNLGPVSLEARKVASAYMFIRSGWGEQLALRNEEMTPEVQKAILKHVEATPKLKNYILMNQAALKLLHPKLVATADSVGVKMGDLGEWYLPFMSENMQEQDQNLIDLVDKISPTTALYGEKGTRTPSQIKTRSDLGDLGDDLARQAHLNKLGRLELRMDHILARYYESSANYIGKAANIKHMLGVLENPMLTPLVRQKHGDDILLRGLIKNIRSEMYPGGRSTALGSGERILAHLRGNMTLAMLGWRPRSVLMQSLAIPQGWAAFASRPRDVTRTLGYYFNGLAHARKVFSKEQFADWKPYQEMIADWPQMKYRAFDPEYRDMLMLDNKLLNTKFARHSLDAMRFVDMAGVASLYKAAKEQRMELNEHKVAEGKMTMEQAQRDAASFALQVIDKTQNPSNLSQRSLLQKESEWMKGFNPFSGQRFVNFNYYVFDIAMPIIEDVKAARGVIGRPLALAKGLWAHKRQIVWAGAVPAMMMGALVRMRLPEDEKEIAQDLITYPFSTIPFIGQWIQSVVTGKFTTYAYDPTMLGAVTRSVLHTAKLPLKAAGFMDGFDGVKWSDANQARRAFSAITGTPDYPLQVGMNFIEQMGWVGKPEGELMEKVLKTLAMPQEERK